MKAATKKKQYVYARVTDDGAFILADEFSRTAMRKKRIRRGDLVRFTVSKPRDYSQWKKAHALGQLLCENLDEFNECNDDPHAALKKLQRLSGIECEDSEIELPGFGKMVIRTPKSLAFDEMEEAQFQQAYSGFCQYLINRWWSGLDESQISQMASAVGLAA